MIGRKRLLLCGAATIPARGAAAIPAVSALVLRFALVWVTGCLSVPDGPAPMCKTTSDCDRAHGEVCEEGVCWGNPPPGPFAAVVSPPSTRHDLSPREIPQLAIPDFGFMSNLTLDASLQLSGRIAASCPPPMMACDPIAGATITVSRRSQFHGGPGFKTVANADADSFAILVPRTGPGDDPYTVTIVPDGGAKPGTGPGPGTAAQVPPLRRYVSLADTKNLGSVELGGLDLPVISGSLTSGLGGLAGYRVSALGRWDATEPPTEVSTVDFTDVNGGYAVTLSDNLVGTVELVARPPDGTVGATVHLTNIDATKSSQHNIVEPATLGAGTTLMVHVNGVAPNGMISSVPGATVSVTGLVTSTLTSFAVADEQVTDQRGDVTLHLLDGAALAGTYRMSITPPASSSLGVMFDQKVSLIPGPPMQLASRVALRGKILDSAGKPLDNVAVTARPSLRFLWTLDAAPQAFVAAIPAATTVTSTDGQFVVWVDANVAQTWGDYDLVFEPPATARAPTYVKTEVQVPRDGTLDSVTLDTTVLPDPAFVHGQITGPDGLAVENAELKIYLVSTELRLCSEVAHAPSSCPIPAQLQGRDTSAPDGTVRLALPR
jgi:hypothetical protein